MSIMGTRYKRVTGVTLIELIIVIVIIAVISSAAVPYLGTWKRDQEVAAVARSLAGMLTLARAEAMRTGSNQLLLFSIDGISAQDAAGNAIENVNGDSVTAVISMDRFGGAENCALDTGDARIALSAVAEFDWGVTVADSRAPLDPGQAPIGGGSTFARTATPNTAVNGILFGPDGVPMTFDADASGCLRIDAVGSGGGALYITNGRRDYAVVQTPLGGTRFHTWNTDQGSWSP